MAEVDQAPRRRVGAGRARPCVGRVHPPLVGLGVQSLVADPDLAHHQQAQVTHKGVGDPRVAHVVARDVEPEPLALHPAAVHELDLEVELDPVLLRVRHIALLERDR